MAGQRLKSLVARPYLWAALIVLLTILVYRPAWHGGFIWDDDDYVTRNPLLSAADGLWRIWFSADAPSQYFPLTYTTFRIERHLWGLNPTGYHCVNILLHAANAILLWRLLARLNIPGAYLGALIFALHPVQVESVAWITERKNVLMGFFFLLTLRIWCEFIDGESSRQRWRYYLLGMVTYIAALTAKSTACTLPAALFLILWSQYRPITRSTIAQIVPFVVLALAMGLVTVWWERFHQGTRGALFALGPIDRLLVATRAFWFYLSKLVWPSGLTFIYPQWKISASDPSDYLGLVGCIALVGVILFARKYVGRSLETGFTFFVATLSPLLGFIMLYTFRYTYVADHYQYLACIGPIALCAAGLARLGDRLKLPGVLAAVSATAIACVLATLSWRQASSYSDIETLWRTTIARNPTCWMAYNNLGIALFERREVDEAIRQYTTSLGIRANYAQTHYNLANALLEKGDIKNATSHAREALRLSPTDPDAYVTLGNILVAENNPTDAIQEYHRALELRPDHVLAHYNLGDALRKSGDPNGAVRELEIATRLDPGLIEGYVQLAELMTEQQQWAKAVEYYSRQLELTPDAVGACNNLAWILASCPEPSLRDGRRAVELAERARRMSGADSPVILHTLAAAHAQNRQFDRATQTAADALALATREGNSDLANDLRKELEIYRSGAPYPAP